MDTNPYANLPKIIYILGVDDAGEFGAVDCPHCGAKGRYIYRFICDDGTHRGAMAGCFSHFPKHEFVTIHQGILEKARDYAKKGWTLASWDAAIIKAIEAFAHGDMSESQARAIIRAEQARKSAYIAKKYGKRGRR